MTGALDEIKTVIAGVLLANPDATSTAKCLGPFSYLGNFVYQMLPMVCMVIPVFVLTYWKRKQHHKATEYVTNKETSCTLYAYDSSSSGVQDYTRVRAAWLKGEKKDLEHGQDSFGNGRIAVIRQGELVKSNEVELIFKNRFWHEMLWIRTTKGWVCTAELIPGEGKMLQPFDMRVPRVILRGTIAKILMFFYFPMTLVCYLLPPSSPPTLRVAMPVISYRC